MNDPLVPTDPPLHSPLYPSTPGPSHNPFIGTDAVACLVCRQAGTMVPDSIQTMSGLWHSQRIKVVAWCSNCDARITVEFEISDVVMREANR
jgi:hypothetical protein